MSQDRIGHVSPVVARPREDTPNESVVVLIYRHCMRTQDRAFNCNNIRNKLFIKL